MWVIQPRSLVSIDSKSGCIIFLCIVFHFLWICRFTALVTVQSCCLQCHPGIWFTVTDKRNAAAHPRPILYCTLARNGVGCDPNFNFSQFAFQTNNPAPDFPSSVWILNSTFLWVYKFKLTWFLSQNLIWLFWREGRKGMVSSNVWFESAKFPFQGAKTTANWSP